MTFDLPLWSVLPIVIALLYAGAGLVCLLTAYLQQSLGLLTIELAKAFFLGPILMIQAAMAGEIQARLLGQAKFLPEPEPIRGEATPTHFLDEALRLQGEIFKSQVEIFNGLEVQSATLARLVDVLEAQRKMLEKLIQIAGEKP